MIIKKNIQEKIDRLLLNKTRARALELKNQDEQLYSNQTVTEDTGLGEDIPLTEDIPDPHNRFENRFTFHNIMDLPPLFQLKGGVTH